MNVCMIFYEPINQADESLVITRVKKKPAAIIDSDSDSEDEFVPKEHKKTDKASKIDSSSEEDDFTVC